MISQFRARVIEKSKRGRKMRLNSLRKKSHLLDENLGRWEKTGELGKS